MRNLFLLYPFGTLLVVAINGIMIKKECPFEEVHKSCMFTEEHICWSAEDRMERVKIAPRRLSHCVSGCFCKKGYVREYPDGGCIITAGCRDQAIRDMLEKLPVNTGLYMSNSMGRGLRYSL